MPGPVKLNRRQMLGASAAAAAAPAFTTSTMAQEPKLTGKVILITGASSGFGYVGALHYARRGAKVIASMRGLPRREASQLLEEAKKEELDIAVVDIDVTSDASVDSGVKEALKLGGGRIDVLVNNAGIGITGPVEVQDMAATQLIFDTNVFGCHRMVRAVLPVMRDQKAGQIFQISSQLGRVILPGGGHYSATKFALEAMGEQLAYELVPLGIDVTIIQPGGYPTRVWVNRNALTAALKERTDADRIDAYPAFTADMGREDGSGRSADPLDVPRAITEIIGMPPSKRPLRRAVHPGNKPQEPINRVSAEVQVAWLGGTALGPLVKAVHD
ncbi:MAG: SDR family oxidoreductase [Sphingopyxis sp.]|nr:SDR family oxidoreductase [Sphingopyxis sp.]